MGDGLGKIVMTMCLLMVVAAILVWLLMPGITR